MAEGIGLKIKAARKKAGLKQKELASRIGVSESRVSQYESGDQRPRIDTIQKIADGLGITPFDLLGPEWFDIQHGPEKLSDLASGVNALHVVSKAFGEQASDMLSLFSELNEAGKSKALDYVSDLSEQPKYQRK